uniref:transposase n=1 Tax=Burkholderia cenocepacia TaxID=95486 RepID=UPI0035DCD5CF
MKENVASHVTLPQSNSATMAKHTQDASGSQTAEADIKGMPGLDDLLQQGARQIIQQAIEAELAAIFEQYSNVKTIDGRRSVVRNGYSPKREIVMAIGPVPVQVPKVRDLRYQAQFDDRARPMCARKSPRVLSSLVGPA